MMKQWETAEELMKRLNADPEFVRRQAQQEEKRLKRVAELHEAEIPLVAALRAVGLEIESAGDLMSRSEPYPEALPVLLEHLQRPYPDEIRDGIARLMAVPDSLFAWDKLKKLYLAEKVERVKQALGVALSAAATDDVIDDVIRLVKDRSNGPSRIFFLENLRKSRDERGRRVLMELGTDPDLYKEVQVILRRLKNKKTNPPGKSVESSASPELTTGLDETSMSFDLEDLIEFLQGMRRLIQSGFGDDEIRTIQIMMDNMEVHEEKELQFAIQYRGKKSVLIIRIFLSDIDAPDVTFRANKQLTRAIQSEFERFSGKRGL